MEGKYTFIQFSEDLDNGYKILFDYVRNRYMIYKVNENSKNPVPEKSMITLKAVKEMFPFMKDIEYRGENS